MEKHSERGIGNHRIKVWFAMLLVLAWRAVVQAQFNFVTNNGTITITRYTGTDAVVTIPSTINDLPVTSIGNNAFMSYFKLTSVMIPNSVTSIGGRCILCLHQPDQCDDRQQRHQHWG